MTPHDSTRYELDIEALEYIEALEDVARMTGEPSDEVVALRARLDFARAREESGQRVRFRYLDKIEALEAELAALRAAFAAAEQGGRHD